VTPLGRCNNNRTIWEQSCQVLCYDLPWTGLLTSGDAGCYRWMAMGVSNDTSGKVLIMDTDMGMSV